MGKKLSHGACTWRSGETLIVRSRIYALRVWREGKPLPSRSRRRVSGRSRQVKKKRGVRVRGESETYMVEEKSINATRSSTDSQTLPLRQERSRDSSKREREGRGRPKTFKRVPTESQRKKWGALKTGLGSKENALRAKCVTQEEKTLRADNSQFTHLTWGGGAGRGQESIGQENRLQAGGVGTV